MPFQHLDTPRITRALTQIAEQPGDLADAFFERTEVVELPPADRSPGLEVRRESGVAVRLARGGRVWLAGRDSIDSGSFRDAWRQVARALPPATYPEPEIVEEPWSEPPRAPEILEFPTALQRALRGHRIRVVPSVMVARHRRWVRVIGTQLASSVEKESFYSIRAEADWGRFGALVPELSDDVASQVALSLARARRAEGAPVPAPGAQTCVLGPTAAAVFLHEAVAHALEADLLALTGHPEGAVGVRLGSGDLNVFDDPSTAPASVRRTADDEGFPVSRRCLLRAGVVEQPLCDTAWARRSEVLSAGAGRRGNRHLAPAPRSTHLEMIPGELSQSELLADAEGGLYLPEAERGRLDPLSGRFFLRCPWGLRIENQVPSAAVGPCTIRGQVSDLLDQIVAIGRELRSAGAGWCAKDGAKLPVWATAPELRLEGVVVEA